MSASLVGSEMCIRDSFCSCRALSDEHLDAASNGSSVCRECPSPCPRATTVPRQVANPPAFRNDNDAPHSLPERIRVRSAVLGACAGRTADQSE
eukprot:5808722-Alexandrium_andersonii.AAC.1